MVVESVSKVRAFLAVKNVRDGLLLKVVKPFGRNEEKLRVDWRAEN